MNKLKSPEISDFPLISGLAFVNSYLKEMAWKNSSVEINNLGNKSFECKQMNQLIQRFEFVALIVRNKIYTCLKHKMFEDDIKVKKDVLYKEPGR